VLEALNILDKKIEDFRDQLKVKKSEKS